MYISMGRESPSSDYSNIFVFTIRPNATLCAPDQIAINTMNIYAAPSCVSVQDINPDRMYTEQWDTNVTSTYLRVTIPAGIAYLRVRLANTQKQKDTTHWDILLPWPIKVPVRSVLVHALLRMLRLVCTSFVTDHVDL